jgi:ATP/maltotriose-dependent transcriptional regulator MalT
MNAPTRHSRSGRVAAAVLAALLGLAATAEAQTNSNDNGNAAAAAITKAEALEAQATALLTDMRQSGRAARLFERAVGLRAEDDPARVVDLRMAGRLYMHTGQLDAARRNLLAGAEAAVQFGDVVSAAHLFIDAALVANKQGDVEAAQRLVKRADCLSRSPLITLADASAIRRRTGGSPGPVFAVH